MTRRTAAAVALGLAALLAIAGVGLWTRATDEQAEKELAAYYERALYLDEGEPGLAALVDTDPEADRTPSVVAFVAAALLAVGGVVLVRWD